MYLIPVAAMKFMGNSTSVQKPDFLQKQPFTWTPNRSLKEKICFSSKGNATENTIPK